MAKRLTQQTLAHKQLLQDLLSIERGISHYSVHEGFDIWDFSGVTFSIGQFLVSHRVLPIELGDVNGFEELWEGIGELERQTGELGEWLSDLKATDSQAVTRVGGRWSGDPEGISQKVWNEFTRHEMMGGLPPFDAWLAGEIRETEERLDDCRRKTSAKIFKMQQYLKLWKLVLNDEIEANSSPPSPAEVRSGDDAPQTTDATPVDEEKESLPPAMKKNEQLVLKVLGQFDPSILLHINEVVEAMDGNERLSEKVVGNSITRLIEERGLVERPEGPKNGARLTTAGRLALRKITG